MTMLMTLPDAYFRDSISRMDTPETSPCGCGCFSRAAAAEILARMRVRIAQSSEERIVYGKLPSSCIRSAYDSASYTHIHVQ